ESGEYQHREEDDPHGEVPVHLEKPGETMRNDLLGKDVRLEHICSLPSVRSFELMVPSHRGASQSCLACAAKEFCMPQPLQVRTRPRPTLRCGRCVSPTRCLRPRANPAGARVSGGGAASR